ncbi:hypothetical protein Pan4_23 [Pseudanabaena phage Pan4]|nr:hypothetical protein Pan4_23 [Pseudanabaena phage Pan4]
MWAAIAAIFGRIVTAVLGRWIVRADAKADQRRETQVIAIDAALKRERKRDEVDRAAGQPSARDRLRSDWSRRD